jgi:hypothetical protein
VPGGDSGKHKGATTRFEVLFFQQQAVDFAHVGGARATLLFCGKWPLYGAPL